MARAKAKTKAEAPGKTVRVVTETVEHHEETGDEIEIETPVDPEDVEDRDALAELEELAGSDARFEVRRTAPAAFVGYVGTYTRDVFSLNLLYSEWGGGNFTLRVKNTRGEYVGTRRVVLAGSPHHKKEVLEPVAVAPSSGIGEMAPLLAAMQSNTDKQIGMLTTLLTGLLNKPPPAAPDPIAIIASLKDILKPDKGDSGADAVKLLLQGVDLGKSLGGGEETSMADVFLKGFDTLKDVAKIAPTAPGARPAQRIPARVASVPPGTVPASEPAEAPNKEVPTLEQRQREWIRKQTLFLVHQAKRKKDPGLYAELFLDNLPDFVPVADVLTQMRDPDIVAKLSFLVPDVAGFSEWFEEFRLEVVEQIENPEADDFAEVDDPGETDPHADDEAMGEPLPGEGVGEVDSGGES